MSTPDWPPTVIPFDLGVKNPTDEEIAKAVNVPLRDLDEWLKVRPDFQKELNRGRAKWDRINVVHLEHAMVHGAVGGIEERMVKGRNGVLTREEIEVPPNFKLLEKFVDTVDPDRWKDKDAVAPRQIPQVAIQIVNGQLAQYGEAPVVMVPPATPTSAAPNG